MTTWEMLRNKHGLTGKQARFVVEYAIDFNGTSAAQKAGYKGSRLVLAKVASENLRKGNIQAALADHVQRSFERADLKAEDVLRELGRVAFSRIDDIATWDEDGRITFRTTDELSADELAGIKKIKFTRRTDKDDAETITVEMEQHAKITALVKLGEYYELFAGAGTTINIYQLLQQLPPAQLEAIEHMPDDDLREFLVRLMEGHGGRLLNP